MDINARIFLVLLGVVIGGCYEPSISMWEAAKIGDMKAVDYYLNNGVDVKAYDPDGNTMMDYLDRLGPQVAGVIFKYYRSFEWHYRNDTLIRLANSVETNDDAEIYVSSFSDLTDRDGEFQTPLHWAAKHGNHVMVKLLINKGANIEARDDHDMAPLHKSVYRGNYNVSAVLLENGADANARSSYYAEPLYWATKFGHIEIVKLLIKHGANVNSIVYIDETAMDVVPRNDVKGIAAFLRKHGAKTCKELKAEKTK